MKIVGCDLHTRYQQIAMLDDETGLLAPPRHLIFSNREKGITALIHPYRYKAFSQDRDSRH